jgi:hypothetical protein
MNLSVKLVLMFILLVCALHYLMGSNRVEGMNSLNSVTINKCTDVTNNYAPLCGLLQVDPEECSSYYTKYDGLGYFCVPDTGAKFFKCKQDDKICSNSDLAKEQNAYRAEQYFNFMKGNRTFEERGCHACGGCGDFLGDSDATTCFGDNTKWCRCVGGY